MITEGLEHTGDSQAAAYALSREAGISTAQSKTLTGGYF
jgi:hypothetical protein